MNCCDGVIAKLNTFCRRQHSLFEFNNVAVSVIISNLVATMFLVTERSVSYTGTGSSQ